MRAYHMTEQPYPEAFETKPQTLRVNLPREVCDPRIAADRFHRYYDEWMLADELGRELFADDIWQVFGKVYRLDDIRNFEQQIGSILKEEGPVFVDIIVETGPVTPREYDDMYKPARRAALRKALGV